MTAIARRIARTDELLVFDRIGVLVDQRRCLRGVFVVIETDVIASLTSVADRLDVCLNCSRRGHLRDECFYPGCVPPPRVLRALARERRIIRETAVGASA